MSPELVLVDPHLGIETRRLLPDPDDTLAPRRRVPSAGRAALLVPVTIDDLSSSPENPTAAALRRITELSEVEPPKRRRRPLIRLTAVTAALGAVAIFAVDLRLGLYEWPAWLPH